jgi:hypothetical protein
MTLFEQIRDDMRSAHAKFHEFSMHTKGDINLSLFSFPELSRFDYMKDVVLDEGIPIKLNS